MRFRIDSEFLHEFPNLKHVFASSKEAIDLTIKLCAITANSMKNCHTYPNLLSLHLIDANICNLKTFLTQAKYQIPISIKIRNDPSSKIFQMPPQTNVAKYLEKLNEYEKELRLNNVKKLLGSKFIEIRIDDIVTVSYETGVLDQSVDQLLAIRPKVLIVKWLDCCNLSDILKILDDVQSIKIVILTNFTDWLKGWIDNKLIIQEFTQKLDRLHHPVSIHDDAGQFCQHNITKCQSEEIFKYKTETETVKSYCVDRTGFDDEKSVTGKDINPFSNCKCIWCFYINSILTRSV